MQAPTSVTPEQINLVVETIQHQDSRVFNALVEVINDMQFVSKDDFVKEETDYIDSVNDAGDYELTSITRTRTDDVRLREHEQRLETILNQAFNSNIRVSIGERYGGVRIHDEYHNHALLRNDKRWAYKQNEEFIRRFILTREKSGVVKGGVDLKNARLSGLFSELPATIYLPIDQFTRAKRLPKDWILTPEECAAMLLHEVGHLFVYCEYFSRVVSTNQVLSQVSSELDNSHSADEREIILTTCKQKLNLRDLDPKALAGTSDKKVIEIAVLTECVEESRSELGCNIYDLTAQEQLSDQFAVRMGAGRAAITMKFKIYKMFGGTRAFDSTPLYMFKQILALGLTLTFPPMTLFVLMGGLDETRSGNYDSAEARFQRIRNDMVNRTKNRNMGEQERKDIINDIKDVDELLEGVKDRRSWPTAIADFIIPTYRKYRKSMQLQKQLEQLASNSLFVRAAELSTL